MKRGIYINMLLRAYSQEVFIPTQIFERCQSKGEFVEEVSAIFKEFITNNIACDDDAIKREFKGMYTLIDDNQRKKNQQKPDKKVSNTPLKKEEVS